jgi:hypothetical protein
VEGQKSDGSRAHVTHSRPRRVRLRSGRRVWEDETSDGTGASVDADGGEGSPPWFPDVGLRLAGRGCVGRGVSHPFRGQTMRVRRTGVHGVRIGVRIEGDRGCEGTRAVRWRSGSGARCPCSLCVAYVANRGRRSPRVARARHGMSLLELETIDREMESVTAVTTSMRNDADLEGGEIAGLLGSPHLLWSAWSPPGDWAPDSWAPDTFRLHHISITRPWHRLHPLPTRHRFATRHDRNIRSRLDWTTNTDAGEDAERYSG